VTGRGKSGIFDIDGRDGNELSNTGLENLHSTSDFDDILCVLINFWCCNLSWNVHDIRRYD